MTDASIALTELAESGVDVDALRRMVQCATQRLKKMEVHTHCAAGYDDKNPPSS